MKTLNNLKVTSKIILTSLIGLGSFNFSLGQSNLNKLQMFENIRYSDSRISYKIGPCSSEIKTEIEKVLGLLEEKTILDFYEVNTNEKLSFTFNYINKNIGKEHVAGEGGVNNVLKSGQFYVIGNGIVNLEKSEKCFNTILHETLHALGFAHSNNPKDVMYPIETFLVEEDTLCNKDKSLGEDIPKLINKLYSISYSQKVSAWEKSTKIFSPTKDKENIIIVHDPYDSRLKSYQDSLDSYNNEVLLEEIIKNLPENKFLNVEEMDNALYLLDKNYPVNSALIIKEKNPRIIKTFIFKNDTSLKARSVASSSLKYPVQRIAYQSILLKKPQLEIDKSGLFIMPDGIPYTYKDLIDSFPKMKKDLIFKANFPGRERYKE